MATVDVMMQRCAPREAHATDAALGRFRRLADRLGHFARLAMAKSRRRPFWSPTTTKRQPNRRPPFTTFATRLM